LVHKNDPQVDYGVDKKFVTRDACAKAPTAFLNHFPPFALCCTVDPKIRTKTGAEILGKIFRG
jgi:hypothetical protein